MTALVHVTDVEPFDAVATVISRAIVSVMRAVVHGLLVLFRDADQRTLEVMVLRHQLEVALRSSKHPHIEPIDRGFLVALSSIFRRWRDAIKIVQPDTVIRWHRTLFKSFWRWKSRPGPGRPPIRADLIALIRRLSTDNPLWGSPRIRDELLKLGVKLAKSTIERYMVRRPRSPVGGTWRNFLRNHARAIASVDFLTVPTATMRTLYVMLVLSHERRRVLHFAVTDRPTSEWAARQTSHALSMARNIKYLLRDNDGVYGKTFNYAVRALGVETLKTMPRCPWQNPYVERLNGTVRRDCLDHVIVFNERHLNAVLTNYFEYYHAARTHQGLGGDAPIHRAIDGPENGTVVAVPYVGGLHHKYSRRAA